MAAFADRSFKGDESATLEQWNKIFNSVNFTDTPFKGSIHDYFCAQSYNQFRPVFDLVYVQVGNAKQYASDDFDENSQYLVQHVMDELKKNPNIDWSLYDWNGDGYINQLLIIYAGYGMNDHPWATDLIWPHQWWMSEHLKDGQPGVYCDPIAVTFGDKQYFVDCYCALEELTASDDYGTFGTICHEYSHCFGFPDFYYGSSIKYLYGWDLMDSGNYNGGGFCPASYSAHERWLMGWLTPVELKQNTTITNMPSLAAEGTAYYFRNDGYEDEYYFVENRQQEKWDASLPGSGVIVFHIDYDPDIWIGTQESPNHPDVTIDMKKYPAIQRYVLFHANNSSTYSKWAYPYNANDSLTNYSSPAAKLNNTNTDGSKLMNKSLRDIRVENGLASFRFTVDSTTGIEELQDHRSYKILYDLGPIYIIRYSNGEIKKVVKH